MTASTTHDNPAKALQSAQEAPLIDQETAPEADEMTAKKRIQKRRRPTASELYDASSKAAREGDTRLARALFERADKLTARPPQRQVGGRPKLPPGQATEARSIRLTPARWDKLRDLGMVWLSREIDRADLASVLVQLAPVARKTAQRAAALEAAHAAAPGEAWALPPIPPAPPPPGTRRRGRPPKTAAAPVLPLAELPI